MFNVRPDLQWLGLRVEPPTEEVPGFRMNADGSIRETAAPAVRPYPDAGGNPFDLNYQPGLSAEPFTPVGDGTPPPYLAYARGLGTGTGNVPSLGLAPVWPAGMTTSVPEASGPSPYTPLSYTAGRTPEMAPRPATEDFSGVGAGLVVDQTDNPNIVRVGDVQIAQNQGLPQVPQTSARDSGANRPAPPPGRGYVQGRQNESGMTPLQIRINRDQAFRELTRQQLREDQVQHALPDDWEKTKPADLVDEIRRAAERHGVPVQMFARQLYQEGKFNEPARLRAPLRMDSDVGSDPIGYAQMTKDTLETLTNLARLRGDTKRVQELEKYSLGNREQSFDAAAEQLAYLHRHMGGNWPKALAAYNYGPGLKAWFDGKDVPISTGKWREMADYLIYALRGAEEEPQTGDPYVVQPVNRDRARDRIYRPAVPSDTKQNP